MMDANYWIDKLGLEPHPEGGYYRETYRAQTTVRDGKSASTAIYFLLRGNDVSVMHRVQSDEVWHRYTGAELTIHMIDAKGRYTTQVVGSHNHAHFQVVVPAGFWFGATVNDSSSYALVGCTMAPGFEFEDLEIADRDVLVQQYPGHKAVIERLTRGGGT